MDLKERISLLVMLGNYMTDGNEDWEIAKQRASQENPWFTSEFINLATENISKEFLGANKLQAWAGHYFLNDSVIPRTVGIVMAGNIPMVGFHDFLCVFICGHKQKIKLSSQDNVLLRHLIGVMNAKNQATKEFIEIAEQLKDCDAYIATGSNNTGRYFEQYFGKYPHIIRKNRTSVGLLQGDESEEDLRLLSDDIHQYFGLGCRNVSKVFVPMDYDFEPLLNSFSKYNYFQDHHKYKNNYDYQLSILLLNHAYYMTNGTTLLSENKSVFSPISVLNYGFYNPEEGVEKPELDTEQIQCICGKGFTPFGNSQKPKLDDYADGVDTMQFLLSL